MRQRIAWSVLAIALSCGMTSAQSTFGTLEGTVTDASGAVVPNATVTITNTDENTSRAVTTDASGNYTAVDLRAGHYSVEVSVAGFKTTRIDGIELGARQTLRADASLSVGEVSQQVEVTGQSVGVITTETETVSSAYNTLEITDLPINYRASGNGNSPYYLMEILPGMQTDQSGNLAIQGGLQSQSQFSVDGVSITDTTGNKPLRRNPSPKLRCKALEARRNLNSPATSPPPPRAAAIPCTGQGSGIRRILLSTPFPMARLRSRPKSPTTSVAAWAGR